MQPDCLCMRGLLRWMHAQSTMQEVVSHEFRAKLFHEDHQDAHH